MPFFTAVVGQVLHQPRAAAVHLERHAAEELALAVDHRRLAPVVRHEARALACAATPWRRGSCVIRISLRVRVGAVARDAIQVVVELVAGVAVPVGVLRLVLGDVGELLQILDRVVGEAHHAAGEAAVAAGLVIGRRFQHANAGALVAAASAAHSAALPLPTTTTSHEPADDGERFWLFIFLLLSAPAASMLPWRRDQHYCGRLR